jgi:hypothetical protein
LRSHARTPCPSQEAAPPDCRNKAMIDWRRTRHRRKQSNPSPHRRLRLQGSGAEPRRSRRNGPAISPVAVADRLLRPDPSCRRSLALPLLQRIRPADPPRWSGLANYELCLPRGRALPHRAPA